MNILNILDQIDFDQTKPPMISVGVVIRKVVSCLHKELVTSLEQLAKSTNIENKKNTIANTIKNMNRGIKKLSKFITNIKKFNKVYKVDLFTSILYSYQDMLNEISNQLYQNQHYCKFIRIPKFNLNETSRILNNTSHKILRNEIVNLSTEHYLFENKEKMFNFHEKYFYLEGLNNNNEIHNNFNIEQVRSNMKSFVEKCYSRLNFGNVVFAVNNEIKEDNSVSFSKKEYYDFSEKESNFHLFLGNLLRIKILFLFYTNQEQKPILTYAIEKIEILGNQKFKEKTEIFFLQKLFELNNIIVELIKIELNTAENSTLDFRLNDLSLLLKNFINKNFSRLIFSNVCNSFRDVIEKKVNIPHKTEVEKGKKGLKISFQLPEKFAKLDFFIAFNLEEEFSQKKKAQIIKSKDVAAANDLNNEKINNINTTKNPFPFNFNSENEINSNIINSSAQQTLVSSENFLNNNNSNLNQSQPQAQNLENPNVLGKMDIDETNSSAAEKAVKNLSIEGVADLINNVTLNEAASSNQIPNAEAVPQNKTLLCLLNKELETENYLVISFSHRIIQREKPFIAVKNHKLKQNLFELNSLNFKEIILSKIKEYHEIVFEKVFNFLVKLSFNFFALKISKIKSALGANSKKMQIYFDKHLLFSICISDNFDIIIQDSQAFFQNKINEDYIKCSINSFLQEDINGVFTNKSESFIKFTKFVFTKFIENYFKFNEINAVVDFNENYVNINNYFDQFAIKVCFVDQKLNNSKCFLVVQFEKAEKNNNNNYDSQQQKIKNMINLLPNKLSESFSKGFNLKENTNNYCNNKKNLLLAAALNPKIISKPADKGTLFGKTRSTDLYKIKDLYILIEPMEFLFKSVFEATENTISYHAEKANLIVSEEKNLINNNNNNNSSKNNYNNTLTQTNETQKFQQQHQQENLHFLNPLIKRHKISLRSGFLIESNSLSKSLIYTHYIKQIPLTSFDCELVSKIIEMHFSLKSSYYEIFMSISEFAFYFQKFQITQELQIFEVKVEENLNSLKNLCRNSNEFLLLKNLISEIRFLNKISGIELALKPELEAFIGLAGKSECKTNSYVEGEYCQSYSPESRLISFNFITKNLQKASDTNFIKKVFDKFLPRLLMFFTRVKSLMENEAFKQILKESENVVLTPLEIKFSYNFFNQGKRTIKLTFLNRKNDFNLIKLFVSNLPRNFGILFCIELINYHQRVINEPGLNIYDNIVNLVFFLIIIEKTFSKFPFHFNPVGREIYDYVANKENHINNTTNNESLNESSSHAINNYIQSVSSAAALNNPNHEKNKVYGIVKEQKKIHLICVDRFNLVMEIQDSKNILIYSHTFDTHLESRDLINSFYDRINSGNNQTIQLINIPGNNNSNSLVSEIKNDLENKNKIIHLLNDKPEELLKVVDVVLDRIQNFGN